MNQMTNVLALILLFIGIGIIIMMWLADYVKDRHLLKYLNSIPPERRLPEKRYAEKARIRRGSEEILSNKISSEDIWDKIK
jgi:hypothetical protein